MKKVGSHTKNLKAFSLVEILLTVTIFTITVMTIVSFMSSSGDSIKNSTQYNEANYYLTEGLEALKNIKESSYSSLNVGTFGLEEVASVWQLTGNSDNTNGYIRRIIITEPDAATKLATTEVSWINDQNQTQVITASLTFKDWNRAGYSPTPTPPLTDWDTPIYLGFDDLARTYSILNMFKQGDFVYGIRNNTSGNFFITDVSNPECPITLFDGTIPTLTYSFTSIAVKDNTVYLTSVDNNNEIILVDITSKTAPVRITPPGFVSNLVGNDNGQTVRIYGDRLYMGRVGAGTNPPLYIYDVTTANNPSLIGFWDPNIAFTISDIFVKGAYAYLTTSSTTGEIRLVNLTNEAFPTSSTIYNLPGSGSATSINGYGNKLLVSNSAFLVYAFDISEATTLTLQDATPYSAGALVNEIVFNATGTLAFTATSNATSEFQILNTSNLTDITLYSFVNITAGTFVYNSVIYDVVTDTTFLGGSYSLEEFAVYRTGPYTVMGWCSTVILASRNLTGTTSEVMDMVKQGDYIIGIRSGTSNNFFIIDVSDPAAPGTPVNFSIALTLTSIAVKDNTAYVSTTGNTSEMVLVNITNKSAPALIATPTFNLAGNDDGRSVHVYGDRLYLARSSSQTNPMLYIYNISTAHNPTLVGSLTLPTSGSFTVYDLYVKGYYAYIASNRPTAEIAVVNMSNEIVPEASTTYDLPPIGSARTAYTIMGFGNKLLVGDSANLLYAFDISNPTTLVLQDNTPFNALGYVYQLVFDTTGDIAFVATANTSLEFQILNVADLTNITRMGSYNLTAGGYRYRAVVYDPITNINYLGGSLTTQEFAVFKAGPK